MKEAKVRLFELNGSYKIRFGSFFPGSAFLRMEGFLRVRQMGIGLNGLNGQADRCTCL